MAATDPSDTSHPARRTKRQSRTWLSLWLVILAGLGVWRLSLPSAEDEFEDIPSGPKVRRADGKTQLWASGPYAGSWTDWFDVTGSELDPQRFEYGIGRDRIQPVDRPLFVPAGDTRIDAVLGDPAATQVIGYEYQGQARAYPISILNHRELVNDKIAGKPITVGW